VPRLFNLTFACEALIFRAMVPKSPKINPISYIFFPFSNLKRTSRFNLLSHSLPDQKKTGTDRQDQPQPTKNAKTPSAVSGFSAPPGQKNSKILKKCVKRDE
jgi:hypothetical protein